MKKTLKIIGNVLLWIFIVIALVIMIATIASTVSRGKNGNGIPSIFGKNMISVQSDSMAPTFKKGNMIFGNAFKNETDKMYLKKGDVITFFADLNKDGKKKELNSHRIVDVVDQKGNSVVNDKGEFLEENFPNTNIVYYKTKGDNNENIDADYVIFSDVQSVWRDGDPVIWGLGSVADFLQSSLGFFLVIVLPCAIFVVIEVISLVKIILENKQKKAMATPGAFVDEEEIKRRAIEEYLKSQQAQKEASETTDVNLDNNDKPADNNDEGETAKENAVEDK